MTASPSASGPRFCARPRSRGCRAVQGRCPAQRSAGPHSPSAAFGPVRTRVRWAERAGAPPTGPRPVAAAVAELAAWTSAAPTAPHLSSGHARAGAVAARTNASPTAPRSGHGSCPRAKGWPSGPARHRLLSDQALPPVPRFQPRTAPRDAGMRRAERRPATDQPTTDTLAMVYARVRMSQPSGPLHDDCSTPGHGSCRRGIRRPVPAAVRSIQHGRPIRPTPLPDVPRNRRSLLSPLATTTRRTIRRGNRAGAPAKDVVARASTMRWVLAPAGGRPEAPWSKSALPADVPHALMNDARICSRQFRVSRETTALPGSESACTIHTFAATRRSSVSRETCGRLRTRTHGERLPTCNITNPAPTCCRHPHELAGRLCDRAHVAISCDVVPTTPDPAGLQAGSLIWVGFPFHVKRHRPRSGTSARNPRSSSSRLVVGSYEPTTALGSLHRAIADRSGVPGTPRARRSTGSAQAGREQARRASEPAVSAHFTSGPVDNRSVRATRHGPCSADGADG